ncbi:MAG: tetratricopeptide repeat protein, partial [Planctomycetes bacterium]|nr:tetratricopeptide repeat protein [Planctomycetota bacterium]
MNALISGQAAVAVLFDGEAMYRLHLDEPDTLVPCAEGDLPRLFADVDDLAQIEVAGRDTALEELERLWEQDRGMHLVLILLDGGAEPETRRLAAECLDESLTVDTVSDFLADRMYAKPLPELADAEGACRHARDAGAARAEEFVEQLDVHQPYIFDRCTAWKSLPTNLFESTEARRAFEDALIDRGYFRRGALAGDNPSAVDAVLVDALADRALRRLPNFRNVLMAWRESCVLVQPRSAPEVAREVDHEHDADGSQPADNLLQHAVFERVERQKDAIELLLKRGKGNQAHRYTEQLIAFQLGNSSPQQLAMTLCDLAQRAKKIGLAEEQLAFANRAVELAPADPQTHTHRADAYKSLGCLDEALAAYDEAKAKFENEPVAYNGRAEVLKDLGRLDDALAAYDEAKTKFENEPYAYT